MARGVPKEVVEKLRAVPLFSSCSTPELRMIASLGTQLHEHVGQTLITQGEFGSEFFLVLEGEASCLIDGKKVATFAPGDYFGELALLSRVPRSATVVVDSDMNVLVMSAKEFYSMLDDSPGVVQKMLGRLAERVRVLETEHSHQH